MSAPRSCRSAAEPRNDDASTGQDLSCGSNLREPIWIQVPQV